MTLRPFVPSSLASLGEAFELLNQGKSVLLGEAGSGSEEVNLPGTGKTMLGLYSSGSAGKPKLCWHSWNDLISSTETGARHRGWVWASSFSPLTFAGVQVALQAFVSKGSVFSLDFLNADTRHLFESGLVQAISTTPTFFDLLLLREPDSLLKFRPMQITLGGEVLRPAVGARLSKAFPSARFLLVYASAELGVLMRTRRLDGWFEIASLEKRFPFWRVVDGTLHVRKGSVWRPTGDAVETSQDLIRVLGRSDSVANVAGTKVCLHEISRTAESVPGVRMATAFAEPNSVSGQIVGLRFLPEPDCSPEDVQRRLQACLRGKLRKEAWPRRWEIAPPRLGSNSKGAL